MSLSVEIHKKLPSFSLDVEFEAEAETLGLLGASGSGKSMTLRCLAGVEKPDSGRIVVAGKTFFDSERGINLSPQQRKTALLFQNYQLFPMMTVAENIACGMSRAIAQHEREKRVSSLLDFFHLRGFGKKYPDKLSGGAAAARGSRPDARRRV
ncbi:MAG: ATP-binding cassette domain-containing protein [Coriobacteriia bacterium]